MKIKKITKTCRPIFKNNKDLKIGEEVLTPHGKKKIVNIFNQGLSEVYKITLSDGRSFRTNKEHLNTVSFRNKNNKIFWENVSTSWILKNFDNYIFNFPLDKDVFSFNHENFRNTDEEPEIGKKENFSFCKDNLFISSIKKVDDENTRCITLDYDLGLYYTGNNIITHNSFASSLWSLYITTHLWSMRNPNRFFGLAQNSSIVQGLISFTMEKASQVLLQPFMQILSSAPKFKRVRQEERLDKTQDENPNLVCWTTAGRMGVLQFYNDIHYIIASKPGQLLGLNMLTAILSEISFFVDQGFSTEYIWRIYQDSKGRVFSRFGNKYFAGTVLDSSPNDIDLSPIDKYIFNGDAAKDKENLIITGSHWDFLPKNHPIWYKTGETFPVFRGSQGKPAKILKEHELKFTNENEIYNVPIDLYTKFDENVIKSVKDYCGWPSGATGTLVRDGSILEKMFDNSLRNIYSSIFAPENMDSRHLIWNEVKNQFFVRFDSGYEFHRHHLEKRYIHIDQSETGDMAAIAMIHPETDKLTGEVIYVTDFTIVLSPEKGRINLDAIRYFIQDLRDLGHLNIAKVSFDQYQSSSTIQYLKSKDFEVERLSVDSSIKPYFAYVSLISSGKIKCGKNIFLKNNIKSLQEVRTKSGKRKIDHTKGKVIYFDGGDWKNSDMGKFAKDASDAHCGAIWNAIHSFIGIPRYIWEEAVENKVSRKETIKKKLYTDLEEKYGFETKGID